MCVGVGYNSGVNIIIVIVIFYFSRLSPSPTCIYVSSFRTVQDFTRQKRAVDKQTHKRTNERLTLLHQESYDLDTPNDQAGKAVKLSVGHLVECAIIKASFSPRRASKRSRRIALLNVRPETPPQLRDSRQHYSNYVPRPSYASTWWLDFFFAFSSLLTVVTCLV